MNSSTDAYMIATKARHTYASDLFDIERVRQAISDRAAEGYRDLRLAQEQPFDLSRSDPARQLETWLESHQYRYAWSPTPPLADPLQSALSEDYPELVVFW